MTRREIWQEVFDRFDPEEPAHWGWRAQRPREQSPAHMIKEVLDGPGRTPKVLLMGTTGTGKTTELLGVAEERAQRGDEFVVFLDLVRHFRTVVGDAEALQHVSAWEVCFLVGVALVRAAEERVGYRLPDDKVEDLSRAWTELAEATNAGPAPPQLNVAALAKSMVLLASAAVSPAASTVATGLKALSELVGAAKWDIPMGRRGTKDIDDQDTAMKRLLDSVNELIGVFQKGSRPVLFVIDGLDRIERFERAEALLLRSEMIQGIRCPLVIAGPFALRHHLATATMRRFDHFETLYNAPVLDQGKPAEHGPGVHFLCELYARRVAELKAPELVPAALLERIAYYSGGRSRDFVRMIRMLASRGYGTDAQTVTSDMVNEVIDEARRLLETGLTKEHIRVLREIAQDSAHELPDGPIAEALLTYARLLPYRNGSEWFYPHALLTIHKVKTA